MKRKNKTKKDHRKAKAIGSRVSVEIWNELKVQALREGRKTGEVLDDAIKLYIQETRDIINWGSPFERK